MMTLKIPDLPVAKKNRRRNYGKVSLPSMNFMIWQDMAIAVLEAEYGKPKLIDRCRIEIEYYIADKYRRDGDNMETSILDMLVKAGWLVDDSVFHTKGLSWIPYLNQAESYTVIKLKEIEYA